MSDALPIRNVLANAAGALWMAGLTIVVVPIYLHILGPSAYGLIGFHAAFQAFVLILDLGMSTTINREIARLAVRPENQRDIPHLLRRMEKLYWCGAALVAVALWLAAPVLASHWFQSSQLDRASIESSLQWMAIVIALQFPFALYMGVLLGFQRHVLLNFVLIGGSALRLGAVVPVILWFPTATAFFKWQFLATAIQTIACALLARRVAGPLEQKASGATFALIGRFALPMTMISILASGATQLDRLIVSRAVPLESFAIYALGATLATGVLALAVPINMSIFPRLSQLVSAGDEQAIRQVYAWALRLAAVVVVPACAVLALFPREVLFAWTRNSATAASGADVLRFLAIGAAGAALLQVPYCLQLAHGMTRLPLVQNATYILIGAPLFLWAASMGTAVCAMSVAALQLVMVAVVFPVTNSRLYVESRPAEWLALGAVVAAGILPPLVLRLIMSAALTPAVSAAHVVLAAVLAASTAVATALVFSRGNILSPLQGSRG